MLSGTYRVMYPFKDIANDDAALAHCPMLRAALLTFEFIDTHGPIELTPSKALKRYFVTWAAEAFAWPYFTAEELYAVNRVLNEQDFPPLVTVHDLLLTTKLARHYRGTLRLTALAQELRSKPGELWRLLTNHLLFVMDHSRYTRFNDAVVGDWLTYLNVINIEAEMGVTEARLCSLFYGGDQTRFRGADYEYVLALYAHVLRPLCWAGLLSEQRQGRGLERVRVFVKTPLWAAALHLPTDKHVTSPTRH